MRRGATAFTDQAKTGAWCEVGQVGGRQLLGHPDRRLGAAALRWGHAPEATDPPVAQIEQIDRTLSGPASCRPVVRGDPRQNLPPGFLGAEPLVEDGPPQLAGHGWIGGHGGDRLQHGAALIWHGSSLGMELGDHRGTSRLQRGVGGEPLCRRQWGGGCRRWGRSRDLAHGPPGPTRTDAEAMAWQGRLRRGWRGVFGGVAGQLHQGLTETCGTGCLQGRHRRLGLVAPGSDVENLPGSRLQQPQGDRTGGIGTLPAGIGESDRSLERGQHGCDGGGGSGVHAIGVHQPERRLKGGVAAPGIGHGLGNRLQMRALGLEGIAGRCGHLLQPRSTGGARHRRQESLQEWSGHHPDLKTWIDPLQRHLGAEHSRTQIAQNHHPGAAVGLRDGRRHPHRIGADAAIGRAGSQKDRGWVRGHHRQGQLHGRLSQRRAVADDDEPDPVLAHHAAVSAAARASRSSAIEAAPGSMWPIERSPR